MKKIFKLEWEMIAGLIAAVSALVANGKQNVSHCGNEKVSHLKPRRKKIKKTV